MSRDEMKPTMLAVKASIPPPLPTTPTPSGVSLSPSPQVPQLVLPPFSRAINIHPDAVRKALPIMLIEGVLYRGAKLVLGGGSKSFKTWCLMDLALCVALGLDWLGRTCTKGNVLYCNFELRPVFYEQRLLHICEARRVSPPLGLFYWNLRGRCYDLVQLKPIIETRCKQLADSGEPVDLIVLDPIYKCLGGRVENDAGDVGMLMHEIESISESTGAAIAFGSHFSKGNQSAKDAIDRIAGSGVFARDPDTILTLTRHKEEDSFSVEAIMRETKAIEPFGVTWDFPLMRVNPSLDPAEVKKPSSHPSTYSESDVLSCLPPNGATNAEWFNECSESLGIGSRHTFNAKRDALLRAGKVEYLPTIKRYSHKS